MLEVLVSCIGTLVVFRYLVLLRYALTHILLPNDFALYL